MLENEANLQEYQNGRKKKKKMMVSESDGCLMEISSTSTVSLEQLNEGLAASSETQAGKEKHGKKKHKKKMEGDIAEVSAEVSVSESITVGQEEGRKRKRRRKQQGKEEEDGAPVVSETEGALVKERKKKKKKKRSEMSDTAEHASEVPDRETVVAEEKVREKKKKRRKDSEMEQDNNTMGAEEMVKKNNNNKKKHFEREENGAGESSSMIPSDDLKEQGTQYKLNSKTQKLTTAYAVEMDLEGEEENISVSAQNFMDASMRKCIEELKKFIPNVETKSPSVISHLVKYDLSRFKILSQEGESFKSGRFSAEENEKLFRNIKDFLALTGISSAAKLFFTNRYPEEAAQIRNMKKLHKFHSQIAVGIFRSWHEIYSRGRKVFDEFNYKGRYTEDELKKLNKLQNLYGNNWMKISELTGRSNISLEKRFSQIAHKKGEWTVSEQKKLMRIIKEYMVTQVEPKDGPSGLTIRKEKLYSNVPWKSVSEGMETRSWVQCRVKWLYEMDVEDSSDVKWEDLTFTIGDVPPAYIQAKFYKLKVTQVPLWQSKSFSDIIDFLYNKVLPKLEKDLKNCEEESVLPKDIFRLSQIFDAD
uniref:Transcription termination factor 1, tandem duplicate 1 n=1 Tax=Paramormyrops kingsleyae TaxID=1676925 RepID=A0A3B3RX30_9TELE